MIDQKSQDNFAFSYYFFTRCVRRLLRGGRTPV
jgi:hypothetical protein